MNCTSYLIYGESVIGLLLMVGGAAIVGACLWHLFMTARWSNGIDWQRGKERLEKKHFRGLI